MSAENQPIKDTEEFRDHVATISDTGKRNWIFPKKPKGRYYNWRGIVSWVLLAFFFIAPLIKINGKQFLLLNIFERKFVLMGIPFSPQDFNILVLAMIASIVFIILFTVVFGRLFCGWVCPQTIFMEMVFRKIDYWIEGDARAQKKLDKAPWNGEKIRKRGLKHFIYLLISIIVIHTFMAYLLGFDELIEMIREPFGKHMVPFITMIIFTMLFYFVFSWLREQVCVAICPYGRLQGVMLDENSVVIAYDYLRGEPRGKKRKKQAEDAPPLGDCVDCNLCVQVCPTGIDIRHGTQLECVNCTACIDACDEVMDKIGRERGLIRYDSIKGIEEGTKNIFTTRVKAYSAVLVVLMGVVGYLMVSRSMVETLILRAQGTTAERVDDTHLKNIYNYQMYNKTGDKLPIDVKLITPHARMQFIGGTPDTLQDGLNEGVLIIEMEEAFIEKRSTPIEVEIYSNGEKVETVETNFFTPSKF